ncbi:hypothetical protein CASFOL_014513 [Castilleja foliolosa]|uniref:Replication factor A C-terminal domain-containing protein n=1 Tax=Castilleja foliolosa TaxID=1961234 RepID=A0ABD3DNN7_9LAMI
MFTDAFCWVDATIVDIEPTGQYWYAACKNCAKKLVAHPGTSTCVGCAQDNSVKTIRYKVEVMVVDKTGTATLLLWNTACELLIGKSAAELYFIYGEYSDQIPKELEDGLIKKRVLFELRLSTFKIVRGAFNCAVSRCAYDDEIMETYTKLFNVTQGSTSDEHGTLTENSNSSPDMMDKNVKTIDKGKRKLFIDEDDEEDDAVDETEKCTGIDEVNAAEKTSNAAAKTSDAASAISPSDAVYKSKRRLFKKEK